MTRFTRLSSLFLFAALAGSCASGGAPWHEVSWRHAPDDRTPEWLALEGHHDGRNLEVTRDVAPGITHTFLSEADGPLTINLVAVDMGRDDLTLEAESGQDALFKRETIPDMRARLSDPLAMPVVLSNADFWAGNSAPVNLFIDEGMIWRGPYYGSDGQRRAVFAFDDAGNHFIGLVDFSAELKGPDGQSLEINGITFPQSGGPVTAYPWPGAGKLPPAGEGSYHLPLILPGEEWLPNSPVQVQNGLIVRMMPSLERTVTLHGTEPFPAWALQSKAMSLSAEFEGLPGKVIGAVGGGPRLVFEGGMITLESAGEERISKGFVETKHPRTAVGVKADGKTLVLASVDGRQPGRAVGIDLFDLAVVMKEAGCVAAMNLDGGGSTTLMVRDELGNFPSDGGGPRAVTNGLVVRRAVDEGPLARMQLLPARAVVAPGSVLPLVVKGFDEDGDPLGMEGRRLSWSIEGDSVIEEGCLLAGASTGEVVIEVCSGSLCTTQTVRVAEPVHLRFLPDTLLMESGDSEEVRLEATLADGTPFAGIIPVGDVEAPNAVSIQPNANPIPGSGILPATITAEMKGTGLIRARAAGMNVVLPVAVDTISGVSAWDFDTLPSDDMASWIRGLRHDPAVTTVTLETDNVKEGSAAWRFVYGMVHGGTTKIELPVGAVLAQDAIGVGFWVYGDGKEQWLRGEIRDSENKGYYANFTSSGGIDWDGEWRFVRVSVNDLIPMGGYADGPKAPLTVKSIYVAQTQEAAKSEGALLLDGLTGITLPEM